MPNDRDEAPSPETETRAHRQPGAHGQRAEHAPPPKHAPPAEQAPPTEQSPGSEAIDAAVRARAEAEVDRRLLESSLVRLRATGHPLLRSMADDLLAGRVSMRELARNPNIAAPIQAAARRYLHWRNSMSAEELKAISDDMAARVQWMRDQVAAGWKKRAGDGDPNPDRGNERED